MNEISFLKYPTPKVQVIVSRKRRSEAEEDKVKEVFGKFIAIEK